jgi:hypothetical protein
VFTRRELIRLLGGAVAVANLPLLGACGDNDDPVFSADELRMLRAFADVVLPPDDQPGGSQLGAVEYIERLVTAFGTSVVQAPATPPIYAGGPYSDRNPIPDASGAATASFPSNDFASFIELDRVKLAAWKFIVGGSRALPDGAPNDALIGEGAALIDQLRAGLHAALALAETDPQKLFDAQDDDFKALIIELVTEAALAAPEYGGNPGLAGWQMVHFEGDVLPLGYSQWNGTAHVERPEAPVSTANPSDPEPMTDDVRQVISTAITVLGGRST